MNGFVHSIQTFSALDGPGIRSVVFMQGCRLDCVYCHNPDSRLFSGGKEYSAESLCSELAPYFSYYRNAGGVTFSGGEPLLQPEFISECAAILKDSGVKIAIDTAGVPLNDEVVRLLLKTELVILDIKATTDEDYNKYIGCGLDMPLQFFDKCSELGVPLWIRHVVLKGINDSEEDILQLCSFIALRTNVKRLELLPYRSLCRGKYKKMGLKYRLEELPDTKPEVIQRLSAAARTRLSDIQKVNIEVI
jgi:pyruvate formate lyase activating enzyme